MTPVITYHKNGLREGEYLCYMVQREDVGDEGIRSIRPMKIFAGTKTFVDGVCRATPVSAEIGKIFPESDDDFDDYWFYETKFFRTKQEAIEQMLLWCDEDLIAAEENFKNAIMQRDNLIQEYGKEQ